MAHRKLTLGTYVAVVALAVELTGASSIQPQRSPDGPNPLPEPFPTDLLALGAPFDTLGGRSPNLLQTIGGEAGAYGLDMTWHERDTMGNWHKHVLDVTASFRLIATAAREGGNEVYLAGMRDDGKAVIKRFRFASRQGGYHISTAPGQISPVGSPMPVHNAVEGVFGNNGVFSTPSASSYAQPTRDTILGNQAGLVQSLEVDPYGRFLMLLTYPDSNVFRVDLLAVPKTLELMFTAQDIPELADAKTIDAYRLVGGGHIYVLTNMGGLRAGSLGGNGGIRYVVLQDSNNDGGFESVEAFTGPGAFHAAGYDHESKELFWEVDVDASSW